MATTKTANSSGKATTKNSVREIRPQLPSRGAATKRAKKTTRTATFPPISQHEYRAFIAEKIRLLLEGNDALAPGIFIYEDSPVTRGWNSGVPGALVTVASLAYREGNVSLRVPIVNEDGEPVQNQVRLGIDVFSEVDGNPGRCYFFAAETDVREWLKN